VNRRLSLLEYSDLPGHFPTFQGSSGKEMGLAITFIPIRIMPRSSITYPDVQNNTREKLMVNQKAQNTSRT